MIFKAPERLDATGVRSVRQDFERLATCRSDVVIDLARTEALDGSGVGAMVYAFKRLLANGNTLTVRNISGQPLDLLHEAGLLRTLMGERSGGKLRGQARHAQGGAAAVANAATAPSIARSNEADGAVDSRAKGAA